MIGVEVRDDHAGQRAAQLGQYAFPGLSARGDIEPGVDRGETAILFEQPDIDVLERARTGSRAQSRPGAMASNAPGSGKRRPNG
jgi:hypothetical protein